MESFYLDNTMMSDYQTCQRRYMYRHLKGLVPKSKSKALSFGGEIHEGLSTWYETGDEEKAINSAFTDYEDDPMDEKRTAARGREILRKYFDYYPQEPFEVIANELPFEQPMFTEENTTYYLIGKIDLIIKWHNFIYGLDHKTTSRLGKYYFDQFRLSRQFMGYTTALKRIYEDRAKQISGFYVNAIAVYKNKFKFERQLVTYTDTFLKRYNRFIPQLMKEIKHKTDYYQNTQDDSIFIPNWDSCEYYGKCPYKEICTSVKPHNIIERNYLVDYWDPRKEFGIEGSGDSEQS